MRERVRMWRYLRKMPKVRGDCRTFALHGDKVWGDSIAWWKPPGEHEGRVYGWVPRLPRIGDRLAVKMQSGKWAAWVFDAVEPCQDPRDMFFGTVKGPVGYLEGSEVPTHASPTPTGAMADYI